MNKKNKIGAVVILFLITVLYSVIVFMFSNSKAEVFWASYSFSILSLIVQLIIYIGNFNKKPLKKIIVNLSMGILGFIYLLVQLISSLIFILVPGISFTVCILLNILILIVFCIILLLTKLGAEYVNQIDEKIKEEKSFIKDLKIGLELIVEKIKDKDIAASLNKLIDKVKYSEPIGCEEVISIEIEINKKLETLEKLIKLNQKNESIEITNEITELLSERNKKCIAYK